MKLLRALSLPRWALALAATLTAGCIAETKGNPTTTADGGTGASPGDEAPPGPADVKGGGVVSEEAMLDLARGQAYWVRRRSGTGNFVLTRAGLEPGADWTALYEEPGRQPIRLIAHGPEGLFFYREATRSMARVSHDGTGLVLAWADMTSAVEHPDRGFVTATHLYPEIPGDQWLRIPLDTAKVEDSPFKVNVSRCAISPDRARAACVGYELDLAAGTMIQPVATRIVGNGPAATDGTHWYFTQHFSGGPIAKVVYGSVDAKPLTGAYPVEASTVAGKALLIGTGDGKLVGIDRETGAELFARSIFANRLLQADAQHVYYGSGGGGIARMPLSELGL